MTIDQLLYMVARIHDPEKSAHDNVRRAMEIVMRCEQVMKVQEDYNDMEARGLSPEEMLREVAGRRNE
jgi:hypothetical protein